MNAKIDWSAVFILLGIMALCLSFILFIDNRTSETVSPALKIIEKHENQIISLDSQIQILNEKIKTDTVRNVNDAVDVITGKRLY